MKPGSIIFPSRIFPSRSRSFKGQRWINISLRTLHLIGICGVGAGVLFQLPGEYIENNEHWYNYLYLALFSGCAMIAIELWSNGVWLIQLRGLITILKLILLSLSFVTGLQPYMFISAIILSGVFSHAPGKVRYYSILHKKVIEHI